MKGSRKFQREQRSKYCSNQTLVEMEQTSETSKRTKQENIIAPYGSRQVDDVGNVPRVMTPHVHDGPLTLRNVRGITIAWLKNGTYGHKRDRLDRCLPGVTLGPVISRKRHCTSQLPHICFGISLYPLYLHRFVRIGGGGRAQGDEWMHFLFMGSESYCDLRMVVTQGAMSE